MRVEDYTPELWKEESPKQKETQEAVKPFGRFLSLKLVERGEERGRRSYRYRLEFENATLLQHIVFDERDKVAASSTEDLQWQANAVERQLR